MRGLRRPTSSHVSELYQTIVQSLADALVIIDQRGVIQSFSPSAERMFGYSASEIVGRNVSLLMPPPDREQHDSYLREYIESGWTGVRETSFLTRNAHIVRPERETVAVRKDGNRFPARLIVSEVETGGERVFVGLLSDLSDRKRLERELDDRIAAQNALVEELQTAYAIIGAQKQRMQDELDVGRQIQLSMVPQRFPELSEVDVWATLRPAREVGGDFYDVFVTPDGQLWLCIGDVSGKGVPAALLMAVTKTLIKSFASQDLSPAEVCTRVNTELSRGNESAMFVTAFIARLTPSSGVLRHTNAGHNPPFARRTDGSVERYAQRHGPVLGAVEGARYDESEDRLSPGDCVLLFTDGVTEALDRAERMFTDERLAQTISAASVESAAELAGRVLAAVERHCDGGEQYDDITLLACRFIGGERRRGERLSLGVPENLDELAAIVAMCEQAAERLGADSGARQRVAIGCDEVFSNIMKYGFAGGDRRSIECEIRRDDDAIVLVIGDDGVPFNPLDHPTPDPTLPLDERPIGGLGVHLVRRLFDGMQYRRVGGRNVLTLRLRIASNPRDAQ